MLLFALLACEQSEEVDYSQFNLTEDQIIVSIGGETTADADTILHSSTGIVEVGSATLSPGGGPIGTTHNLTVIVSDEYEDLVSRVSVKIDSGDRGEEEFELVSDSADEGLHMLDIVSVGDEGELRDDILYIRLWHNDPNPTTADTGDSE